MGSTVLLMSPEFIETGQLEKEILDIAALFGARADKTDYGDCISLIFGSPAYDGIIEFFFNPKESFSIQQLNYGSCSYGNLVSVNFEYDDDPAHYLIPMLKAFLGLHPALIIYNTEYSQDEGHVITPGELEAYQGTDPMFLVPKR
jgi:hypothetical protein